MYFLLEKCMHYYVYLTWLGDDPWRDCLKTVPTPLTLPGKVICFISQLGDFTMATSEKLSKCKWGQ